MFRSLFFITVIVSAVALKSHLPKGLHHSQPKQKATCSDANIETVRAAYSAFLANYGLSLDNNKLYDTYIEEYSLILLFGGVRQFEQICGWSRQLTSDMRGLDTQNACLNDESLSKALGISVEEASEFVGDYFRQLYECGVGYTVFTENFYCIRAVDLYHRDALDTCAEMFIHEANVTDVEHYCWTMNDFIACDSAVFGHNCGEQVRKWTCGLLQTEIAVYDQTCNGKLHQC